jgi:hypothetical protein
MSVNETSTLRLGRVSPSRIKDEQIPAKQVLDDIEKPTDDYENLRRVMMENATHIKTENSQPMAGITQPQILG